MLFAKRIDKIKNEHLPLTQAKDVRFGQAASPFKKPYILPYIGKTKSRMQREYGIDATLILE